jgi:outer membrane protein assembly factor BamB
MVLRGDLASVDLSQVFQMLALNKKVGLLSIQGDRFWRALYFEARGVTLCHNVHEVVDRIVTAMVRTGRLTEAAVEEVHGHAANNGKSFVDGLLAGGYLDEDELADRYRTEIEEQIYELFLRRDARFEFHENVKTLPGREATVDERHFFNCDSVIMEAARRMDEWSFISQRVPTQTEVFRRTVDELPAARFSADAKAVFQLLDGYRTVAGVVEASGLVQFQVCKSISQMIDAGACAAVPAKQLLPLADECMRSRRVGDAIRLYERSIAQQAGLPDAFGLAARACQEASEFERAVGHFRSDAEHRLAAGDRAGAAAALFEIRAIVPTDLQAREDLIGLATGRDAVHLPGYDHVAEGRELVELLGALGQEGRLLQLLEHLVSGAPDEPDFKKAMVGIHLKAGDHKRVIELYEAIAADHVRHNQTIEAVAYLHKILLLDRSRTEVEERIRALQEFDVRKRRRGAALGTLTAILMVLLVLGGCYWYYDMTAATSLAAIDVRDRIEGKDFAAAEAAYVDFIAKFPYTTALDGAHAELRAIADLRHRHVERTLQVEEERRLSVESLRKQYRQEWARHRTLFFAGKAGDSVLAIERVRQLVAECGETQDSDWAGAERVEETLRKLQMYIAEADSLADRYAALVKSGDWRGARAVALRLRSAFDNAEATKRCPLPIEVASRPTGALIAVEGGVPGREGEAGAGSARTPTVVYANGKTIVVTLSLEGFQARRIEVDAGARESMLIGLDVQPVASFDFGMPAQAGLGVGVGRDWLAVALRGGRIGVARTDGSQRRTIALPGLRAVDSDPVVADGSVFFVSNENTIECVAAADAARAGWSKDLPDGAATGLGVGEGRVLAVDRKGVLHGFDAANGQRVFQLRLDGSPAGAPVVRGKSVYVGLSDGRVVSAGVADGSRAHVVRAPAGLAAAPSVVDDVLITVLLDGRVAGIDAKDGRLRWTHATGQAIGDGDVAIGEELVVIRSGDDGIVVLDARTGAPTGQTTFDGVVRSVALAGRRAFVACTRARAATEVGAETLFAVDVDGMAVAWEFGGVGIDSVDVGGEFAVLAPPSGQVLLFR